MKANPKLTGGYKNQKKIDNKKLFIYEVFTTGATGKTAAVTEVFRRALRVNT
jgi:hypothetical protein